ncbi:MAG: hypothetical protein A4E53_01068 [Pelotomaculum sp. PtaB.Bin104]|nr:MAG: hypothetical protein A4E53_01068 [Pelotomaculum sp. PtaB.Bin104]
MFGHGNGSCNSTGKTVTTYVRAGFAKATAAAAALGLAKQAVFGGKGKGCGR